MQSSRDASPKFRGCPAWYLCQEFFITASDYIFWYACVYLATSVLTCFRQIKAVNKHKHATVWTWERLLGSTPSVCKQGVLQPLKCRNDYFLNGCHTLKAVREGKQNKPLPSTTVLLLTPGSLLPSLHLHLCSHQGSEALPPTSLTPTRVSPPALAGARALMLFWCALKGK